MLPWRPRDHQPSKGRMVYLVWGGSHFVCFCNHTTEVPPRLTFNSSYDASIQREIAFMIIRHHNNIPASVKWPYYSKKKGRKTLNEAPSMTSWFKQPRIPKENWKPSKKVSNGCKKASSQSPFQTCPYQSNLGSYIKNILDINESHIPAIFQFAIHHLLIKPELIRLSSRNSWNTLFQNHWKKKKSWILLALLITFWGLSIASRWKEPSPGYNFSSITLEPTSARQTDWMVMFPLFSRKTSKISCWSNMRLKRYQMYPWMSPWFGRLQIDVHTFLCLQCNWYLFLSIRSR